MSVISYDYDENNNLIATTTTKTLADGRIVRTAEFINIEVFERFVDKRIYEQL